MVSPLMVLSAFIWILPRPKIKFFVLLAIYRCIHCTLRNHFGRLNVSLAYLFSEKYIFRFLVTNDEVGNFKTYQLSIYDEDEFDSDYYYHRSQRQNNLWWYSKYMADW